MDTELRYGGGTGAESTKGNRRIETNAKRPSLVWNAAATMQQLLTPTRAYNLGFVSM